LHYGNHRSILRAVAPPRKPTDAELAILRVLWARGPSTVREVHDAMSGDKSVAYTTTLKTLQVMYEKGLTVREDHRGQHLHRAKHAEEETLHRLVTDLMDRAFGGSTSKLVIQALTSRRASPEELRAIRKLLSEQTSKDKGDA
jgi:predicted transcriptional regulator